MNRLRARNSVALVALLVVASGAACSLTVDLSGYAGGGDDAGGDGAGDAADTGEETAEDTGGDTLDTSAPPDTLTETASDADANDASDAVDAHDAADSTADSTADTADAHDAADSTAADASDAGDTSDSSTVDASDAADASDASDTADANPCATVHNLGLSEIMVRTISGTGDTHEWFELTNYDASCTFDVGGLRVTTQSWSTTSMAFINKANATVPAGLKLAPGASLVFADLKATFLADASSYITTYGLDTSLIVDLNFTFGDLFVNGYDNVVEVYYPGATLPSESVTVKARGTTWPTVGRSFEFPVVCDSTLRLLAGSPVTTSAHWVDTTSVATEQYGTVATSAVYGTPGRKNDQPAACP